MLLEPAIDKLVAKVGNPYKLAVLVSKRAKYLQGLKVEGPVKEITKAMEEIQDGNVLG